MFFFSMTIKTKNVLYRYFQNFFREIKNEGKRDGLNEKKKSSTKICILTDHLFGCSLFNS